MSIVLVHDKADNAAQVTALLSLLVKEDDNYRLNTTDIYPVRIHSIVPVDTVVSNINSLGGSVTWYTESQSQVRYYNRALLRGDNQSGSMVVIVRDATQLTVQELIDTGADLTGNVKMAATQAAYYFSSGLVGECGVLYEDRGLAQAMLDFQSRLEDRGYAHG